MLCPVCFNNKRRKKCKKKEIDINELRKAAVEYRPDVNVWKVQKQANDLYTAIKLFGIENITAVYHMRDDIPKVRKTGKEISKRSRSLSAYLMMNALQMSDSTTSQARLEKHYGGISLEAGVGYIFGKNNITVNTWSTYEILEKYFMNKYRAEEHYNEIWIKNLYNLIICQDPNVDLWEIWTECEKVYKSVITVGAEKTVVWLYNENKQKLTLKGKEIPERIRAFVAFVAVHMFRLRDDDVHLKQLQERFMLSAKVKTILGDTNIFVDRSDNMKCISLSEIVGRYLKREKTGKFNNKPICLQLPYNAIEMKYFNTETESIEDLWTALDAFYKVVKIVGVDDAKVRYIDANKKEVIQSGREVPARIRAFAEEAVLYMYRMVDSDGSRARLEEHFGLEYPSKYILGDTKVVSCKGASLPCMSLKEMLENL